MKLSKREKYLKKIRPFYHDEGMIKVITGVRRCGKSCIMATIAAELEENGVSSNNIIYLDLDKRANSKIDTPDKLEELIDDMSIKAKGKKYLFIDEVPLFD